MGLAMNCERGGELTSDPGANASTEHDQPTSPSWCDWRVSGCYASGGRCGVIFTEPKASRTIHVALADADIDAAMPADERMLVQRCAEALQDLLSDIPSFVRRNGTHPHE